MLPETTDDLKATAGLPLEVISPRPDYAIAKMMGRLDKTDAIDARALA